MLEQLAGPIASVQAEMTDMTGVGFSTMALSLKFANGAVGSLVGSYDSSYAYPGTHQVEINGTEGRITIDDTVKRYRCHRRGDETGEVWEAGYFNDFEREFHRTFDRYLVPMLEAFKRGAEPPVHARAGYRALTLAAIESCKTGRRVDVDKPHPPNPVFPPQSPRSTGGGIPAS